MTGFLCRILEINAFSCSQNFKEQYDNKLSWTYMYTCREKKKKKLLCEVRQSFLATVVFVKSTMHKSWQTFAGRSKNIRAWHTTNLTYYRS